jgi:carboxyl-terminal processing protease
MIGSRVVWARRLLVIVMASASCMSTTQAPVAPPRPVRVQPRSPDRPRNEDAVRLPPRPPRPGAYDLGQLPVLTKVLFHVRENYFDKRRINYRQMAMGALYFVQRDVPEVVVERDVARGELKVSVAGQRAVFSIESIDQAWSMRAKLQDIFRFIQANLPPLPPEAEGPRLLDIEMSAVNGMLYTLDPHSVLLAAADYAWTYSRSTDDRSASVGLTYQLDPDGRVLVIEVEPSSPAASAGILAGDRLARIDGEATQNMTLPEVFDRLHGPVGSKVDVTLERPGRRGSQTETIVRVVSYRPSVAPAPLLLDGKIGYVRLRYLAADATRAVHEALQSFNRDGADGIILDLRGNSGGLYVQAIRVADEFVDQGTIASMVGPGGSPRKDETATATAVTPQLPLVVLVDHQTASGAEVIAAALKNLDRGVVIGERTFGMGSVQVLFEVPSPLSKGPDDHVMLGLKLTTAEMLAAGGAAIQGWGVLPDISTQPVSVAANDPSSSVHLQASRHNRSESDFQRSLPSQTRPPSGVPAGAISYFKEDREEGPLSDPETDPLVALARQLLRQNKGFERHQLLAASDPVLASWRDAQDRRLAAALARRRVDWSTGPAGPPPPLQLALARADNSPGAPGRPVLIRGTVKNLGSAPAFRVRAVISSDDPSFDEAELVFGQIAPGQSKSCDVSIARWLPDTTRTVLLKATLLAQDHALAGETDLRVDITGPPRSALAFRYQVVEGAKGPSRSIEIPVTVTNRGPANIAQLRATVVTQQPGPRVRIPKGRFELRDLAAGASRQLTFVAYVDPSFAAGHCRFKVTLESDSTEPIERSIPVDFSAPSGSVVEVDPPRLTLQGPAVVTNGRVHIEGTVTSPHGVHDVYILVWNRSTKSLVEKVLYQLNQPPDGPQMSLAAEVPVTAGLNGIAVFARDCGDLQSAQTLMVLKE